MSGDSELELLLSLDGASFEASEGMWSNSPCDADVTNERPHGISYALVLRPIGGAPWVKFDNAHAVVRPGRRFVKATAAYDHWRRTQSDAGRPYAFSTAMQLLEDF